MSTDPNKPGEAEPKQTRERRPMTRIARQLRRELTPAEARLWQALRDKQCGGLRFLRQHDVGHFVLDFYCAALRLAVEVDGTIHDLPEVQRYDADREAVLQEEYGICFLRFTNAEVMALPTEELHARILEQAPVAPSSPAPTFPASGSSPTPLPPLFSPTPTTRKRVPALPHRNERGGA